MINLIYIDGDSSPIKDLAIDIAKKNEQQVTIYFDDSHLYTSDYAKVITVSTGKDSVDYAILKDINNGDILITDDYGLASLALIKMVTVITSKGIILSNDNINSFLTSRFLSQKERLNNKHLKGPKKRTSYDDKKFCDTLNLLLENKETQF